MSAETVIGQWLGLLNDADRTLVKDTLIPKFRGYLDILDRSLVTEAAAHTRFGEDETLKPAPAAPARHARKPRKPRSKVTILDLLNVGYLKAATELRLDVGEGVMLPAGRVLVGGLISVAESSGSRSRVRYETYDSPSAAARVAMYTSSHVSGWVEWHVKSNGVWRSLGELRDMYEEDQQAANKRKVKDF